MELDPTACYRAVLARDARYDGVFFTCVRTTGIYCRPICPARPPKPENCRFVPSAAAAQEAGFRPCLRCRPESSPDMGAWRGSSASVSRALVLIEDGALDAGDVEALADRLGMGARQLRRLFRQHLGASPVAVAQTRRVLLAKQLIHQTGLSMAEVALASGFGSVRRFNETFQALYGRGPLALRRAKRPPASAEAGVRLLLPYRPPYDWAAMLEFLQVRAIPGVEAVSGGRYRRVIELGGAVGEIEVSHAPADRALAVTVRFPHLKALPQIIARLRRLFDLSADPAAIAAVLSRDPDLAPLAAARPGLRIAGAWDGFEIAVRAVLGQQVTLKAGVLAVARLADACAAPPDGVRLSAGLTHPFPRPDQVSLEACLALGGPKARAHALAGLAAAAEADPLLFSPRGDLEQATAHLRALPGVGEWTAQYIALRALRESDAFLAADVALQRALATDGARPDAKALAARAEAWRPWRAYAVMHLWAGEADKAKTSSEPKRSKPDATLAA